MRIRINLIALVIFSIAISGACLAMDHKMDHSMHAPPAEKAAPSEENKLSAPAEMNHEGMENCPMMMNHGGSESMSGMDHSTMNHSGMNHSGMGMHVMPGIPDWMFFSGIAAILILSFGLVEILGRGARKKKDYWKYDLMNWPWFKWLVKRPFFQFIFQFPVTILFIYLLYAGLYGHPILNITPIVTWTIWWVGIVFLILFLGKAWCTMCPWDLLATLVQRLKPWGVQKRPMTLGLKWPAYLANIYPATILFLFLTWLELGYKVTLSPRYTAYFAIGMVVLAVSIALVFEKKVFCRYACLVGRVSGLYALFSPVEIRRREAAKCAACAEHACFNGNDRGMPCPTSMSLKTMDANTYCIQCAECVRSCPHDNVAMNIRSFGADLLHYRKARIDEALLAIIMLSMTSFHGLTMTPLWDDGKAGSSSITGWISAVTGAGSLGAFTIGMAALLAGPFLIYVGVTFFAQTWAGDDSVSFRDIFTSYAYSLLPIALFYHLAHNGMHLFMEGQNVFTVMSDPLGSGTNYFGTADKIFPPILGGQTIWLLQVALVVVGHVCGILIAHYSARKLYSDPARAIRSLIPMMVAMVLFSFFSLWIMHLSMNMRGSLM